MSTSTLKLVERAARKRSAAEELFKSAVRDAHLDGQTLRAIAAAAGLSHARVFQIVRDE